MSNEVVNKILEAFASKADGIQDAVNRLTQAIEFLSKSQDASLAKLDAIHLELRELKTAITLALQKR